MYGRPTGDRKKTLPFAKPLAKRKRQPKNHRDASKVVKNSKRKSHGKTTKSSLIKRLDQLVGSYARSIGYCQMAGKDKIRCGGAFQWCHIITRGNKRLRWQPENYLVMCAGHHRYYTTHNLEFGEKILSFWKEKWDYVFAHKDETLKLTIPLLEELVKIWEMKTYAKDTPLKEPPPLPNHNWFEISLDEKEKRFKDQLRKGHI